MYWCLFSFVSEIPEDGASVPKPVGVFKRYVQLVNLLQHMHLVVYFIAFKNNARIE
jgi:hypothetical protein